MTIAHQKINNLDLFTAFNVLLFALMCVVVYYDRFIAFRGKVNIHEFYIYAVVIFSLIVVAWMRFRHVIIATHLLVMVQIGILIHFAGAFVQIDGHRLYDERFWFGVRYDKWVHAYNSCTAVFVVSALFARAQVVLQRLHWAVLVLCVLGLGAIVEIVEFFVSLTVTHNGVGGYHNNMFDLVANLCGSLVAVVFLRWRRISYVH